MQMIAADIGVSLRQLWEQKPDLWLFLVGIALFVLFVVDTWRHNKHRSRRKEPPRRH